MPSCRAWPACDARGLDVHGHVVRVSSSRQWPLRPCVAHACAFLFLHASEPCSAMDFRRGQGLAFASSWPTPGTRGNVEVPSIGCTSPLNRRCPGRDAFVFDSEPRAPVCVCQCSVHRRDLQTEERRHLGHLLSRSGHPRMRGCAPCHLHLIVAPPYHRVRCQPHRKTAAAPRLQFVRSLVAPVEASPCCVIVICRERLSGVAVASRAREREAAGSNPAGDISPPFCF